MTTAYITPNLLTWARERSQVTLEFTAAKAHIEPQRLLQWEKGDAKPTVNQAKTLARILKIPFGYLFLSSPPKEKPVIPDLRSLRETDIERLSPDFTDLLHNTTRQQQWYSDHLQFEGARQLSFIASFKPSDDPALIARNITETLNINAETRRLAKNWSGFFTKLVRAAEEVGIVVQRSGIVGSNTRRPLSTDEFKGFSISDPYAPLIFINGNDYKAAQIFTLAHELAHLWLGASGISNQDLGLTIEEDSQEIEKICDTIATEFLVPRVEFEKDWQEASSIQDNVYRLVRIYRVSSLVVLRRAFDLGRISRQQFFASYQQEKEKFKKSDSSGGSFYPTFAARNSRHLASAIVTAAYEGKLLFRDAARMLNVKVKTVESIAAEFRMR